MKYLYSLLVHVHITLIGVNKHLCMINEKIKIKNHANIRWDCCNQPMRQLTSTCLKSSEDLTCIVLASVT